ncbi:MAG: YhbY family RNA-binding protein [Rhodospirillales bacterium]|mgnify:FL=1|jgi:RNA-binding protein|nr:YhbY family RNA-binding protein [Rhodospirillales bacterium]|tara:strand:+ start:6486 stop:6842 length:357 start_codon:yes stop_codon:yes gene_type:complete
MLLESASRKQQNTALMRLSNSDKKRFRSIGHNLNPVLIIAQKGLNENIRVEIQRALTEHELIKIKLITSTREEKKALTDTICDEFSAECIQSVGHVILLYRAAKKPDPRLSNVARNSI